MQITRIEFEDADDPKSACNDDEIRIRINPEAMITVFPSVNKMIRADEITLGQMLRMAYHQGKDIGVQVGRRNQEVKKALNDSNPFDELAKAFNDYKIACYGCGELLPNQLEEVRQAFLSGIHWLITNRDAHDPKELTKAIRKLLRIAAAE